MGKPVLFIIKPAHIRSPPWFIMTRVCKALKNCTLIFNFHGIKPSKHMYGIGNFKEMRGDDVTDNKTPGVWHQRTGRKTKISTKKNKKGKERNPQSDREKFFVEC